MPALPRCLAVFFIRTCRLLCLLSLLGAAGCGKREDAPAAPGVETPAAAVKSDVPAPAPPTAPAPPKPALVLTQELESAVVCVRVTMAQTLVREQTGVLLRPESFVQSPLPAESLQRLVAVLLPAYDEAALRDPGCAIHVLRRKLDANDKPYVLQCQGALAHFDAKTHAALVQYTEDFACRLDGGLSPGAGVGAGTAGLSLLAATYEVPPPPQPGQPPPSLPKRGNIPYAEQRGTMLPGGVAVAVLPASLQEGALRLEPAATTVDARVRVAAVLDGEGRLAGFASRKVPGEESWAFQALALPPAVEELRLLYVPQSVETGPLMKGTSWGQGWYHVTVKGVLKDPLKELQFCRVAVQNLPTPGFPLAADVRENQQPLLHDGQLITVSIPADGSFRFELRLPKNAKSAFQLVQVQLVKKGGSWDGQAAFHAAPFLIVSKSDEAGALATVLGLDAQGGAAKGMSNGNANADASMPAALPANATPQTAPGGGRPVPVVSTVQKTLSTESRILHGVPLCGGREVLLRLEGAPYWKRLSLAEGKWLPLPAVEDLGACHLAGNKDAIFVVHPSLREIRRYNATTLALEKTGRLPDGMSYQGVAAGCLTADGPVAVLTDSGALACDARELLVRKTPNLEQNAAMKLPPGFFYQAAGDGGAVWGRTYGRSADQDRHRAYRYEDDVVGFSNILHREMAQTGRLPTMAATAPWDRGISGEGICAPLINSPNFFLLTGNLRREERGPNARAGAPRCTFYSFYADAPWATVDVPEARDVPPDEWRTFVERMWLDPESLTLAVWHAAEKITLHTLDKAALPQPAVPVLLNYPDCHVPRGGSFHFKPQILGSDAAEVSISEPPEGLTLGARGTVDWQAPQDMLPEHVTFGLKLAGAMPAQRACELKVKLRLGGQKPLVAVPASLSGTAAETAVAEMGQGKKARMPLVPLSFRHYMSSSPIEYVSPGLNDYLALQLRDRTLQLLSLKDWQVEGSRVLQETDCAFMAGDAVFIYNTATRVLTRHTLPGFTVTHHLPMPGKARLFGLAAGVTPSGPLTLLQVEVVPHKISPTIMTDKLSVTILDKQTLSLGRWAPYYHRENPGILGSIIGSLLPQKKPVHIPCSNDGRVLNFPNGLFMISPGITVNFNYYRKPQDVPDWNSWGVHLSLQPEPSMTTIASPMGGRMFSQGLVFFNNFPTFKVAAWWQPSAISRCGNYIATVKTEASHSVPLTGQEINIFSAADGRPLLNLAGLDLLRLRDDMNPHDTGIDDKRPLVTPLGDKNLLVLLSRGGTVLEAVDLDFERVCRLVNPATACFTSHPFPVVAEGRTLEYQVTVSNPEVVSSYELRDSTLGAEITPQGRFTYQAPPDMDRSRQFKIAVLIRFTNGETAVQEFPIYVIALKAEAAEVAAERKAAEEKAAKKKAR
ncbi:MAG: hypothetical protein K9N47_11970 [Prosthecobacter sp.]|uniref:hypothetical protein n=1 Tax=Prosthecobacter sp. TaxID=1965333 RepID=UPI0026009673|nr:hypothetical protein [Prosthecobacter sp.]MCF7786833.1 hypothetical protein [Prosthecobacter sp.]